MKLLRHGAFGKEKPEKLCNLRGNLGNEKLDVQGAIFLTGFICGRLHLSNAFLGEKS